MLKNKNIFIPVADDGSDELGPPRVPPVSKKRKKHQRHQTDDDFIKRVIKLLFKYWTILLCLPALVLITFEVYFIGIKSNFFAELQHDQRKTPDYPSNLKNLDRLDPPRCLKLLPDEELERLKIPLARELSGPVKELIYLSSQHGEGNVTFSRFRREGTRFNLFTGDQSLEQREKSFKMNETAEIYCGFYSENGGFKISDEDKSFMQTCEVVVSTCTFGDGDEIYQPIGMPVTSLEKVCFVAFWDDITLAAQESRGRIIGSDRFVGKWRIVVIKDSFTDQRLNGKIPKMLGHRLFPNAKYSIWVDSKSQFRRDPLGVLEALLWRSSSVLAISQHARSTVYREAEAVVEKHKASAEEVEVQLAQHRQDGLPDDKRLNGKKALNEASIVVREHTPFTNLLMCLWFNEMVRFTSRDQLSFPYVLWRLKLVKDINIFPVCIRKDLVNSTSHRRKAKPFS